MSRKLAPIPNGRDLYEAIAASSLTPGQADVLRVLWYERDQETGVFNAGNPEGWLDATAIARKARVSRRTVVSAMESLRELGVVEDVPKAEMPRGARHTYRLMQGWFRLDMGKIPRLPEVEDDTGDDTDDPATCATGSQVEDEPGPPTPSTCATVAQVAAPTSDPPVQTDPPPVIHDHRTCDPGSQAFRSGNFDQRSRSRSIDAHPSDTVASGMVKEALRIAAEVAKAEELHELDHTDVRRISQVVTEGLEFEDGRRRRLEPDDLASIGAWIHDHDLLEDDLRRTNNRRPFWRGHRRHWTSLLKNPVEVEKRIADGFRIRCARAPVVELPMLQDQQPEPEPHQAEVEPEPELAPCPAVEPEGWTPPPAAPAAPVVVPERLRRIRERAEARSKATTSGP